MRILKVDIPKSSPNHDGLDDIKMDKLGPIVLIAGKNGSGKTRILNKIFSTLSVKPKSSIVLNEKRQLEETYKRISGYESNLRMHQTTLPTLTDLFAIENNKKNISDHIAAIEREKQQIPFREAQINWKNIVTDEFAENYVWVPFVPKDLGLSDNKGFSKNEVTNSANQINQVGVNSLARGTLSKIQVIQDRWFNATHPNSSATIVDKQNAIDEYERLNQIIEVFLNTRLGRTIDDDVTLFSLPMGSASLSDGQKVLLQFCLAIHSQETNLKDLILVMDEPENHLHPSVVIETIQRIQKCVSNGQVWIATHSIPLLAHFDPSLIWYVEKNKIQHAGKIPERVLESLLGDENEVSKLQDFISLPSQYATSRYAFECLLEPAVVQTGSTDPQSIQIRTELLKLASTDKLRVLDYGVGKGRLISNIVDLDETSQTKLISSMDYIAFDKYPKDMLDCETALTKAYGNSDNRYFNDVTRLLSIYDKRSFDVVIMCNVLHEIDPKDWLKLFQNEGLISSLLSENGILLLVEDHQIPIGEKAYQKGFLVLDTPQLKELFKVTEKDKDFSFSEKKEGRLKAHHIPKRLLTRIDEASRLKALKLMSKIAKEKILEARGKEANYQNGKLHGFWTQQFANAQLNIAEFTVE